MAEITRLDLSEESEMTLEDWANKTNIIIDRINQVNANNIIYREELTSTVYNSVSDYDTSIRGYMSNTYVSKVSLDARKYASNTYVNSVFGTINSEITANSIFDKVLAKDGPQSGLSSQYLGGKEIKYFEDADKALDNKIEGVKSDYLKLSGGDMSGRIVSKLASEKYFITPIVSGVLTLDFSLSNVFYVNLNQNITSILFTNVPDVSTMMTGVIIRFIIGGNFTVAWPNIVKFPGGTAPAISSVTNEISNFTLFSAPTSNKMLGFFAGNSPV